MEAKWGQMKPTFSSSITCTNNGSGLYKCPYMLCHVTASNLTVDHMEFTGCSTVPNSKGIRTISIATFELNKAETELSTYTYSN
ncbi:hypothetical protein KEM48_008008 [Puccinia striiformis f. sp. tritici PST-130]|nr:hypothetical protein KEM48_008008 [Puccinia striiformis f. sp. tritici PST-130]